ncbi:MAG: cysteine--tRNA ligase [Firmicutes bacterium]|nr:cysteine--tRNA ligase [Bacillota bacterium]
MKLYNTLSRKKQDFMPLKDNTVRMYSCGPTVYNFAHIGNLRTYIFMDILRRVLRFNDFKILGVMNITDVGHLLSDADEGEDKMVKAAKEQKKSPEEISEFYTGVFFEDLEKLNIQKPEVIPKATEHIKEMIEFVKGLLDKGYAYEIADGIYFDIGKFSDYGKLSGLDLEEQIAGARVNVNEGKRHPADFALWKAASKEHIMQWPSPWGQGYPGWHIECSAMAKKYLGDTFDIHTGGVDHIPIHHENEIAQSFAQNGVPPSNFWMHGEFMLVDNGKMSKRLGNVYTISQLNEKGYSSLTFRYFCLNAHYRKKLNFSFEGLDGAKVALERLYAQISEHKNAPKTGINLQNYFDEFTNAVNDDLNIPKALGILWTMVKLDRAREIYDIALKMDKIFGLSLEKAESKKLSNQKEEIPNEILKLAAERLEAKKNKDYAKSDEIRKKISELGYTINDTAQGFEITKN